MNKNISKKRSGNTKLVSTKPVAQPKNNNRNGKNNMRFSKQEAK